MGLAATRERPSCAGCQDHRTVSDHTVLHPSHVAPQRPGAAHRQTCVVVGESCPAGSALLAAARPDWIALSADRAGLCVEFSAPSQSAVRPVLFISAAVSGGR